MAAKIIQGDVFDALPTLAAGSVDVCVTSPPYWQLRSYLPKDHPLKPRELGSEPTPSAYVARMVEVFRLVRRAMAPHATCWVNIGDSYSGGTGGPQGFSDTCGLKKNVKDEAARLRCCADNKLHRLEPTPPRIPGIPDGNLCLIPQRLAIALQEDGWLCRSVIVWHKPAPMPGSMAGWRWVRCRVKVKPKTLDGSRKVGHAPQHSNNVPLPGVASQWAPCPGCPKCLPNNGLVLRRGKWRPTSSWEPVLMLAKGPAYYADGEAVKTPAAAATVARDKYTRVLDDPDEQFAVRHDHETVCENGANLRDVWTIAAEPLKERHYASFPSELVYRCLAAGTSARGYCPACSAPWARVVETRPAEPGPLTPKQAEGYGVVSGARGPGWRDREQASVTTLGWRPSCGCIGADTFTPRPGMILDCFAGSGRTGVQAQRLGLDFTGVELSPAYCDMAERILERDGMPLFQE